MYFPNKCEYDVCGIILENAIQLHVQNLYIVEDEHNLFTALPRMVKHMGYRLEQKQELAFTIACGTNNGSPATLTRKTRELIAVFAVRAEVYKMVIRVSTHDARV